MKRTILVLLMAFAGGIAVAQNDVKQTPFLTKTLSAEMVKEVEAETSGGNISVESVAAGQERVEVFIWASSKNKPLSKEEIQKRLDEFYELKIDATGNKLTAIAKPTQHNMNWKNALSISFKIYTAQNITTHLSTSGGNINLATLAGKQKITTSGGNLIISHVKGSVKGVTSGGNIEVTDSDDDLDLTTSGGNIDASNCTGKIELVTSGGDVKMATLNGDVKATTSGGNIKADDIKGELNAHTSGGNINMAGLACNLNTGTSGGDVTVSIKEPGKFIKLSNSGGKIDLELPAGKGYNLDLTADKIKTGNLVNFTGKADDKEVKGTVNGGGTEVTTKSNGGKINVSFK